MTDLGANVYLWDRAAQDVFLAAGLAPALRGLKEDGIVQGFWFERFDARGPHLWLLFTVAAGRGAEARQRLEALLGGAVHPSPAGVAPDRETIEQRHRMTRGARLCAADELPGLGEDGTYLLFEPEAGGYPWNLAARIHAPEALGPVLDDLAGWSLARIEPHGCRLPSAAGIRWMAGLDAALVERGLAREVWRYYAATLLHGLEAALAGEGEDQVAASSRRAVGEENRRAFTRIWEEVAASGPPWGGQARLVETLLPGPATATPFLALRQIAHGVWKQLGLPVQLLVPLALYAWTRTMA